MRTIALVDDNPSLLQSLDRLLLAHGFRVQTFTSAELFLDGIANCEAECLVLDIHLSGISGIELQRQLISSGRDLPVIFMTAIDTEATREAAYNAGPGAVDRAFKSALGKLPAETRHYVKKVEKQYAEDGE